MHQGKIARPAPISRHPAFPAIVALWFAALLGLGSLVLPTALIEALVRASGIAAVVPATEPPLGVTARISIALLAAYAGAAAGLFIARRVAVAQAQAPRAPSAAVDGGAKRPISAREELGAESLDTPIEGERGPPIAGRRRALSVTDESGPSAWLEAAPLPGEAEVMLAEESEDDGDAETGIELVLDQVAEDVDAEAGEPDVTATDFDSAPAPAFVATEPLCEAEDFTIEVSELDAPPMAPGDALPLASIEEEAEAMTEIHDARPFDAPEPIVPGEPEPEPEFSQPTEHAPATGSGDLAARPLDELSMAELVERFALSLHNAAERQAAAAETVVQPEPEPEPEPVVDVAPEPARYVPDLGVAAEAPAEPAMPAAMRPVAFGEDAEDEDALPLLDLPLSAVERPFARPAAASFAEAEQEEDDESEADDGFSSLLDLRSKLGNERDFVRIDDEADVEDVEPVVVFPGHGQRHAPAIAEEAARTPSEPQEPAPVAPPPARPFDAPGGARPASMPLGENDTERALRDALHKLQQMSGAA